VGKEEIELDMVQFRVRVRIRVIVIVSAYLFSIPYALERSYSK
jgi:hypothetical protein